MKLENKKVAIIGFGLTGRAVVDFLLKKKVNIAVFDEKSSRVFENIRGLKEKGVRFYFGPFNFEKIAEAELIVMSPGVSSFRFPEFKKLEQFNREVVSEIELAFRFLKGKLICVTGTNGKSTTATLVHNLFSTAGRKSFLLGNIGVPFVSQVENIRCDEYAVVEVSCFQLEHAKSFKPDYVILTNISADHLDRYPSMKSYVETRKNIFKNITSEDKIILNFDDPLTRRYFPALPRKRPEVLRGLPDGQLYWFSRSSEVHRGVFVRGNNFMFRDKEEIIFFKSSELPLIGLHMVENALAACLVPILEGIEIGLIQKGLKSFQGLKHRIEFVTHFAGVDFINDSKATNVDAVLKAVMSLNSTSQRIVIIMGGKDKGGDFSLLKPVLTDKVKLVVLIGEAASKICTQLNGAVRIKKARSMQEAVRISFEEAKPQGIVLLSPGCASFDMFNSFEHRGELFKEEVLRLKKDMTEGEVWT
ncbi:MAG: UDP-N-acetylmuramoylalanine--D-glutamate ligase [Actinobacteria bacterium]|nr:UDP-N-acetylmuramoylalanine--D-glutamate ligase [Actinomycetota bacterium]